MSDRYVVSRGERYEYRDTLSGKSYFSVSQVLDVLMPGTFANVPKNRLEATRERGQDLHYWFARIMAWKADILAMPEAPDGLAGYVSAIIKWTDDYNVKPILVETVGASDEGFAGTVDTLCSALIYPAYHGAEARVPTIVDLKSGQPKPADAVQVQAYWKTTGYTGARQGLLLYIRPDGTYKCDPVRESDADYAWFLNGLAVLKGRAQRGV